MPRLCPKVSEGSSALFAKHFFSGFLARNDFGGLLDLGTIISEFQRSPSMYHASIALGALDLSRRSVPTLPPERKDAAVGAFTAYHTSIAKLKAEIESNNTPRDVNLWTTFFLGLFEVCSRYLEWKICQKLDVNLSISSCMMRLEKAGSSIFCTARPKCFSFAVQKLI